MALKREYEPDSSDDDDTELFVTEGPKGALRINFVPSNTLPAFLVEWLKFVIPEHGGRVYEKSSLPVRGYILVYDNADAQHRSKLATENRFVVNWKWVVASIEAKRILGVNEIPKLGDAFVKKGSGTGWKVFIYDAGSAEAYPMLKLAYQLSLHGAQLVDNEKSAEFIICHANAHKFETLTKKYLTNNDKFVEPPSWVKKCINAGTVKATLRQAPQVRSLPTAYSDTDVDNLMNYLAERVPVDRKYKASRLSQKLYDELHADPVKYPWGQRHQAQGWREYYKNRRDDLNIRIDAIVRKKGYRESATTFSQFTGSSSKRPRTSQDAREGVAGPSNHVRRSPQSSASGSQSRHVMARRSSGAAPPRIRDPTQVYRSEDEDEGPLPTQAPPVPAARPHERDPTQVYRSEDENEGPLPTQAPTVPAARAPRPVVPQTPQNVGNSQIERSPRPPQSRTAGGQFAKAAEILAASSSNQSAALPVEARVDARNSPSAPNTREVDQMSERAVSEEPTRSENAYGALRAAEHDDVPVKEEQPDEDEDFELSPVIVKEEPPNDDTVDYIPPTADQQFVVAHHASLPLRESPPPGRFPSPPVARRIRSRSATAQPQPASLKIKSSRSQHVLPVASSAARSQSRVQQQNTLRSAHPMELDERPQMTQEQDELEDSQEYHEDILQPTRFDNVTEDEEQRVVHQLETHAEDTFVSQPEDYEPDGPQSQQDLSGREASVDFYTPAATQLGYYYEERESELEAREETPRIGKVTQELFIQREAALNRGQRLSEHAFVGIEPHPLSAPPGPETQELINEHEKMLEQGRRLNDYDARGRLPSAVKGKWKASENVQASQAESDIDFEPRTSALPPRSAPSRASTTRPVVQRHLSNERPFANRAMPPPNSVPYQQPQHQPRSSLRQSRSSGSNVTFALPPTPTEEESLYTQEEDSDEHFNGLEKVLRLALRKLATRYKFSAQEVRQKYELHREDLAATKEALEKNRRILDEDSLFAT